MTTNKYTSDNATYSSYRVFETLKFLIKQPATVPEIIKHLESLKLDGDTKYSKAVIYKYISTLKFAGIDIKRHKCRYRVEKLPFTIQFDEDEIVALKILNEIVSVAPEQNISENIINFLNRLKAQTGLESEQISGTNLNLTERPTEGQLKTIKKFEKILNSKTRVKVIYNNILNEETIITGELQNVYYKNKKVYIRVYNTKLANYVDLNTERITKFDNLPQKCTFNATPSITRYKLKGRLAKTYTLRNEEISISNESDGTIDIINKNESKEDLFLRLMRYSNLCEIRSSKLERDYMQRLIESTLKNYEES